MPKPTATQTVSDVLSEVEQNITKGTPRQRVYLVDPEGAKQLLEKFNTNNRKLKYRKVLRYANQMEAGKWKFNGVPVIFSNRRLIDGQHRLEGVVKSGKTLPMPIVFGIDDEAFDTVDLPGASRTGSDVFKIRGVKNPSLMAGAAKVVHQITSGKASVTGPGGSSSIEHSELYEFYKKHTGLQNSAWVGNNRRTKIVTPSLMTALHYLFAKKDRDLADEYVEKITLGIGFTDMNDPAYIAHKKLSESAMSRDKKLSVKAKQMLLIKGWNAARKGEKVTKFGLNLQTKKLPTIE